MGIVFWSLKDSKWLRKLWIRRHCCVGPVIRVDQSGVDSQYKLWDLYPTLITFLVHESLMEIELLVNIIEQFKDFIRLLTNNKFKEKSYTEMSFANIKEPCKDDIEQFIITLYVEYLSQKSKRRLDGI